MPDQLHVEVPILELLPPPEVTDWIGGAGLLRVEGVNYHLPTMDVGELNALHTLLALHAENIRAQLAAREVEQQMVGSLLAEALQWRNRARYALGLKKKQMSAIHGEFARRKAQIRPLSDFAFEAVKQLYGEVGFGRVMARARDLQAKFMLDRQRRAEVYENYGPKEVVCDDKLPYESQDAGVAAIEGMEATGQKIEGLTCYGPCPYCGKYHLGHGFAPKRQQRKKVRVAMEKANQVLH